MFPDLFGKYLLLCLGLVDSSDLTKLLDWNRKETFLLCRFGHRKNLMSEGSRFLCFSYDSKMLSHNFYLYHLSNPTFRRKGIRYWHLTSKRIGRVNNISSNFLWYDWNGDIIIMGHIYTILILSCSKWLPKFVIVTVLGLF